MIYKLRNILFRSKLKRALSLKRKSSFQERWENFIDHWYNVYTDLIIVPYELICRFFKWGYRCRWNYCFEACSSVYMLIYYDLKDLIDYSRKYGHLMWNSKENGTEFRRLKIACELAKRLWENNYNVHMNEHEEKWGKLYMDFEESSGISRKCYLKRLMTEKYPHLKEIERKEWNIAHKMDDFQHKHEREYLFKLLNKYVEGWWD